MKAVVLLSGGLDSSTLLYYLRNGGPLNELVALTVHYGQKHSIELLAAKTIAHLCGVEHVEVNLAEALRPIFRGAQSSQVGANVEVPHGHYAAENMKTTIVPNRNMMLLSIAGALCVSRGGDTIAYAAHAGDHAIYPDCRPEFYRAMDDAFQAGNDPSIKMFAPFITVNKTEIARIGHRWGVPFQHTWSCYDPQEEEVPNTYVHCGACGTCVERREAFTEAGVVDPTTYATQEVV